MKIDIDKFVSLLKGFLADTIAEGINRAEKNKRANLMNIEQACDFLNVTRTTLRKWTREGHIKGFKLNGSKWCYDYTDLCTFADERKVISLQYQEDKRSNRQTWKEKRAKGEYKAESQKNSYERQHQIETYTPSPVH